jgi:hypothetical protein
MRCARCPNLFVPPLVSPARLLLFTQPLALYPVERLILIRLFIHVYSDGWERLSATWLSADGYWRAGCDHMDIYSLGLLCSQTLRKIPNMLFVLCHPLRCLLSPTSPLQYKFQQKSTLWQWGADLRLGAIRCTSTNDTFRKPLETGISDG